MNAKAKGLPLASAADNEVLLRVFASPLATEPSSELAVPAGQTLDAVLQQHCPHYRIDAVQAVIVSLNSEPFAQAHWAERRLLRGDELELRPRPQDPVSIAIAVVVGLAAAALVHSLIDVPDIPSTDYSEPSPTYSVNIQGNRARLGSPVPDRYGRRRFAPDFAHDRYSEFEGDDEYWHLLYAIGQGSYQYHGVYINQTDINNFDDVELAMYEPGQRVSLFSTAVYSADEVSGRGLELFGPNEDDFSGYLGPFVANQVDTDAEALAIDLDFPQGLGRTNDNGDLETIAVELIFQYRAIDEQGKPVPGTTWQNLVRETFSAASFDRIRLTRKLSVPAGRYEVRAQRLSTASDSTRVKDKALWAGLRAYLRDDNTFEHSVLAIRIRASAQLSASSDRRIFVDCTRLLPVWSGSQWLPPAATRNPAWAMANMIKANYGGRYSDRNINLASLLRFAEGCEARGDYFDGHFDVPGTLWKNLQSTAATARAYPVLLGSRFGIVRDEPNVAEVYHFSSRHIVRGSTSVRYKTLDQWADDSVEIEYTDPSTWLPDTVVASLPGSDAQRPQKVKMPWITNRQQAFREAMFMAAKQHWRNRWMDFQTELEGRLLRPLSRMLVVSEMVNWGQGGDVLARHGSELSLSEPPNFSDTGDHFIWLRNRQGQSSEPLRVVRVPGQAQRVRVLDAIPDWLYTEGGAYERSAFSFGRQDATPMAMLMESSAPSGSRHFNITAVIDDPRVYQYDALINDGTIAPTAPPPQLPGQDLRLRGVSVVQGGTLAQPVLALSWSPVPEADYYVLEQRSALNAAWAARQQFVDNRATLSRPQGLRYFRLAAMAGELGPWYEFSVDIGADFDTPPTPSGLQLDGDFDSDTLRLKWADDELAAAWRVVVLDGNSPRIERVVTTPGYELGVAEALLNQLGRSFNVQVYALSEHEVPSNSPATIAVSNAQVPALTGLTVLTDLRQVQVRYNLPSAPDFAGVRVWLSEQSGFDPASTAYYEFSDTLVRSAIIPVEGGRSYYVRIAAFDVWGRDALNISAELTDVARGIRESDLNQLLQSRIDLIDAPGSGLVARLQDETQNRISANATIQQQIDTLELSSDVEIYVQPTEPAGNIKENARWFDNDDGNRPYVYKNGAFVDVTNQRILDNEAAIVSERTVRESEFDALANNYNSLSAEVYDGITGLRAAHAAVTQESQTRATELQAVSQNVNTLAVRLGDSEGAIQEQRNASAILEGEVTRIGLEYSLRLDNNGYVVGYGAYNNGPGNSAIVFRADKLAVGAPGASGVFPFYVAGNRVYMRDAYIRELDASKISGDMAQFFSANIDNIRVKAANIDNLVLRSGQSQNYRAGQRGWKLEEGGGAEFNDGVVINAQAVIDTLQVKRSALRVTATVTSQDYTRVQKAIANVFLPSDWNPAAPGLLYSGIPEPDPETLAALPVPSSAANLGESFSAVVHFSGAIQFKHPTTSSRYSRGHAFRFGVRCKRGSVATYIPIRGLFMYSPRAYGQGEVVEVEPIVNTSYPFLWGGFRVVPQSSAELAGSSRLLSAMTVRDLSADGGFWFDLSDLSPAVIDVPANTDTIELCVQHAQETVHHSTVTYESSPDSFNYYSTDFHCSPGVVVAIVGALR